MRKVYYDQDPTMVNFYAEVLESEGMRVLVKNVVAQFAAGEVPFQDVYPEVWVLDDEDYERAVEIIREIRDGGEEVDFSGVNFDEGGLENAGVMIEAGMVSVMKVFGILSILLVIGVFVYSYFSK